MEDNTAQPATILSPSEIPPMPPQGDPSPWETYKMVGRSLTEWEQIEYTLSRIYSILVEKPDDMSAIREYGTLSIFRDRSCQLESKANTFFISRQNQELEARLQYLLKRIRGYADRRNEVAHGVVSEILYSDNSLPSYGYALIPAPYQNKRLDNTHLPTYGYTSKELQRFTDAFMAVGLEAVGLKLDVEKMLLP
jgi:hypothetical protein